MAPSGDDNSNPIAVGQPSASIFLMLYLEILSYQDLYGVMPVGRRIERARRIAHKFLFPMEVSIGGSSPSSPTNTNLHHPPPFDMRNALSDDIITDLEQSLTKAGREVIGKDGRSSTDAIGPDIFSSVRSTLVSFLTGPPFASFLASNECARMRSYLRGTHKFVDMPLEILFADATAEDTVDRESAHNHILFIIIYLMCGSNKETIGENIVSNHEGEKIGGERGSVKRLVNAVGGLGCANFIKRNLVPHAQTISDILAGIANGTEGTDSIPEKDFDLRCHSLLTEYERFWEIYLAPSGGILDSPASSNSNEAQDAIDAVRLVLIECVTPPAVTERTEERQHTAKCIIGKLVNPEVLNALIALAGELIHDYAIQAHSQFREHKFHEWMCSEITWAKVKLGDARLNSSNKEESTDCASSTQLLGDGGDNVKESCISVSLPPLKTGCISRLMRKSELPGDVSRHIPIQSVEKPVACASEFVQQQRTDIVKEVNPTDVPINVTVKAHANVEYAIVFGTDEGMDSVGRMPHPAPSGMHRGSLRRFACVPLAGSNMEVEGTLSEEDIPSLLEKYAVVPPIRERPFSGVTEINRLSNDGWEISLVDFMIPKSNATASESKGGGYIFGVSLVLNQASSLDASDAHDPEFQNESHILTENDTLDGGPESTSGDRAIKCHSVASEMTPEYNRRLQEVRWSQRVKTRKQLSGECATIAIALISGKNFIPGMREGLSRLFDHFSHSRSRKQPSDSSHLSSNNIKTLCNDLVDVLGIFSHRNVEEIALISILEQYLTNRTEPYLQRPIPILDQNLEFEAMAGEQLVHSLPPIPLALTFLTALLEQKIVISSSRRSILVSVTTALVTLMKPLEWSHLLMPSIPADMAADLVHYPAPFILGIPSEDRGSSELLRSLPDDVTLVDLDVGRVILARTLAHDEAGGALRSQVLNLAESLGGAIGRRLHGRSWCCDSPLSGISQSNNTVTSNISGSKHSSITNFSHVQCLCEDFITELLVGSASCSFWIEEQQPKGSCHEDLECSVLFDEERFFHIKNLRAQRRYMPLLMGKQYYPTFVAEDIFDQPTSTDTSLALSLDDFDLVLEAFLRCQGMSTFISSRQRTTMAFW